MAVVGGGIAGLALAAGLDPERFDVTIHEERPDRAGLGTALAMWPAAQRALRRVGAHGALEEVVILTSGALRTLDGRTLVTLPESAGTTLVSRTRLLAHLDARAAAATRVTGRVEDPAGLDADLVVGADGAHSAVRRALGGTDHGARLTPYLAVRGLVPPQPAAAIGEYWGAGRLFGITPVPDEATNWFCAYRSDLGPRGIDVAAALDDARDRVADACPAVRAVLAAASPERTLAQRIWTAPPLGSLVRGRVVLIGDAAHAMAPNLGRGAGESLVDAAVLADALSRLPVPDALRHYETTRRLPGQGVRVASDVMARVALARRGTRARDAALGLVGTALSRSRHAAPASHSS